MTWGITNHPDYKRNFAGGLKILKNKIETVMSQTQDSTSHHITTDDIAFSAWLKMRGYTLTKISQQSRKSLFEFNLNGESAASLKMSFINSEFITYYNELRNLKKLI